MAPHASPASRSRWNSADQTVLTITPKRSSARKEEAFDVDKITSQLKTFATEIDKTHSRLVQFTLREIIKKPPEQRHQSASDDFADMPSIAEEPGSTSEGALRIQFKLHVGSDKHPRKKNLWFPMTFIKPTKQRVPKYRFHHVEISRNISTPNTQLRFIPFLRDLDGTEEARYYQWIEELRDMDKTDGMDTLALDPAQAKAKRIARDEYAATLHAYLEHWIEKLGLEHCNRSALIRYMASQATDDDNTITPQQKSTLLDSDIGSNSSPRSHAAAKAFTEAFDRVFGRRATLRDVLLLDEAVEALIQNKKVKEPLNSQNLRDEELLRDVEQELATYALFNCLICFGHDCEHGSMYDDDNTNSRFSISNLGRLAPLVRKRWTEQTKNNPIKSPGNAAVTLCKNECFQGPHPTAPAPPDWKPEEVKCLKSMFATLGKTSVRPECAVATILGRKCWDVRDKIVALGLSLPYTPQPPEQPKAKNVAWYDRGKKMLMADWGEQTISHDYQKRLIIDPCHHEGPCTAANKCPCVLGKLLCERFCQCSPDCCPYKFTGCACHSTGKTCVERQKEGKPCICRQLNRECDPVLCTGCGAAERANQLNAHDDALHATGCQNVAMQRGISKAVVMGQSQLDGCGYGLFTAEDISQDEFIIEYTGELINANEGVRREARRGNVFDEASNTSYLFTLLDTEGIWVDAAIYGNLSRYINHAGDEDKRGANITPKIVYVNGEFRIRFTAMRDIKTGEELFFNYGDNFPNLTKKLLEDKDAEAAGRRKPGPKRKPGRPPSKTTVAKNKQKESDFAGGPRKRGGGGGGGHPGIPPLPEDDDDDYDEYRPERVSRRGGARPGAGRKPKNPKPAASAPANEESEESALSEVEDSYVLGDEDDDVDDSDDVPLVETGRGYTLRTRKRKLGEDREEEEGMLGRDYGDVSELGRNDDSGEEEGDDEDEDEDVVDRARRKRQKPARYRADE
ncbi:hypothetical protein CONLIGDRAFT_693034 [Coniochaeta ligniaria NRRL 30616]|uniref:SET domain-containing protein n=1 Tax=Coniochaeta ligniaria NRRL 30616 TaxID=1408157 RepID=A0A1J7J4G4_9PEZI|nr:hypothetical protein CONLIGDRAFT_693034 [Coniochaeta ligniaria NRRL 30616]